MWKLELNIGKETVKIRTYDCRLKVVVRIGWWYNGEKIGKKNYGKLV